MVGLAPRHERRQDARDRRLDFFPIPCHEAPLARITVRFLIPARSGSRQQVVNLSRRQIRSLRTISGLRRMCQIRRVVQAESVRRFDLAQLGVRPS